MKNQSSILSVAIVLILTASSLPAQQTTAPSETPAKPAETPAAAAEPAAPTLDFGVFRSQTIVGKVWAAYNAKNHAEAQAYARKCIEMYKDKAVEMQKALKAPATVEEEVHKNWALNDVGTCYYILGDSLHTEGQNKEALEALKFLVDNLSYAQCWDPKGWFWKPADGTRERVKALEFDALK